MLGAVLRVVLAVVVGCLSALALAPSAHAADRDCGDFATQAAAQIFFNAAGPGDPHRLDSDGDGVACESNPCPCGAQAPVPLVGQPAASPQPQPDRARVDRRRAVVVRVTDGDTLKVRIPGVGVRSVRIIGIDTPEVYGGYECGGPEASAQMKRLAPVGAVVRLVSDPSQADRDRYGRWLRYVIRRGRDVGRAQIRLGHARTYVYNGVPFRRTRDYRRAERAARSHLLGSWTRCW